MTSQTSTTSPSSAQLDSALLTLRDPASETTEDIWTGLRTRLQVSDDALASALWEFQGIASISESDLSLIHLQKIHKIQTQENGQPVESHCFELMLRDRVILLCEDPWSPGISRLLAHGPSMDVALARPGQLKQLNLENTLAPAQTAQSLVPDEQEAPISSTVVQFVEDAIVYAYREGASDIHFETNRAGIAVKYRLDGVMASGTRLDDPMRAEEVISRIKVMAQLDITERRRPQDGRIHWSHKEKSSVDLRVSIMPSIFGEDAVLRLLDKAQLRESQQSISLKSLGFEDSVVSTLRGLASRPHGMLLITGPTGSGKTTTTYAALSEVNDGLEKIITIEDPVEYELPGVLQIPVNEQKGLTFATGLRSILRHDPDKILVGEIRDAETAQIAVQSSLTGHLVFTTVHANSLFDVLGRFHHFGIEPFALASALNGVVVQRLLRKLCPHFTEWRDLTTAENTKLQSLDVTIPKQVPVAKGCPHCRNSGYRGRFVIAEVHELNDTLRDMIVNRTSHSELKTAIYADGNTRLVNQALRQVEQGTTSLEEVIRVIGLV
jgi:general secretion pathway protein E